MNACHGIKTQEQRIEFAWKEITALKAKLLESEAERKKVLARAVELKKELADYKMAAKAEAQFADDANQRAEASEAEVEKLRGRVRELEEGKKE